MSNRGIDPRYGKKKCDECFTWVENVSWEVVKCDCRKTLCMDCYVQHKSECPAEQPEAEAVEAAA